MTLHPGGARTLMNEDWPGLPTGLGASAHPKADGRIGELLRPHRWRI